MQNLFSPDSLFMRTMSRICDLLTLNLLFLLTSVPVFTVGASAAALYAACFRLGTEREEGVVKGYFRAFRENFRQGTALWLILLAWIAAAGFNTYIFFQMTGVVRFLFVICGILLVLSLLMAAVAFPLQSRFDNTVRATLKNALLLGIAWFPRVAPVAVMNIFPLVVLYLNLYVFFQTGFLWLTLYFSSAAYLGSLLLKPVFAPYLPVGEEDAL